MTQDERWGTRYKEVLDFIETNHRNPSKHRIEEHDMLNWLKANRKVLNAGKMKPERVETFKKPPVRGQVPGMQMVDANASAFFVTPTGFNNVA